MSLGQLPLLPFFIRLFNIGSRMSIRSILRRGFLVFLSIWLILPITSQAQSFTVEGEEALTAYLEESIDPNHIPGMVALVVNKSGIIYERAFGLMDSANGKEMQTDSIFRLASMTKAVTSVGVMMLVEEGKISLDDPIADYLPELGSREVFTSFNLEDGAYTSAPAEVEMTIRHLLTHTSGLGYSFISPVLTKAFDSNYNVSATTLPLLFEPGTQWHYGEGTRVLGHLVERVSGQDLYSFMGERIFTPLDMNDIHYEIPVEKNYRTVTVHRTNNGKLVESANSAGVISSPENGDGGLSSTASDFGCFLRMLLNQGRLDNGGQLLSSETVRLMGKNHIKPLKVELMETTNAVISNDFPLAAETDGFGLGFQITVEQVENMRSPGSMAWAGIFNTEFWIDPQEEIAVVLLMQLLPFYDDTAIEVLQGFEQRIYQNLE